MEPTGLMIASSTTGAGFSSKCFEECSFIPTPILHKSTTPSHPIPLFFTFPFSKRHLNPTQTPYLQIFHLPPLFCRVTTPLFQLVFCLCGTTGSSIILMKRPMTSLWTHKNSIFPRKSPMAAAGYDMHSIVRNYFIGDLLSACKYRQQQQEYHVIAKSPRRRRNVSSQCTRDRHDFCSISSMERRAGKWHSASMMENSCLLHKQQQLMRHFHTSAFYRSQYNYTDKQQDFLIPVTDTSSEFILKYNMFLQENQLNSVRVSNFSSKKKFEVVLQVMRECQQDRYVNKMELQQLAELNRLDASQMMQILNQARQYVRFGYGKGEKITAQDQETVKQWLIKNKFRMPDSAERDALLQGTNLTSVQLSHQLYRMIDEWDSQSSVSLPQEDAEAILKQWLEAHDNRPPTSAERDELQKKTGWKRKQLNFQISKLRYPPGEITVESKAKVIAWIELHGKERNPTEEEQQQLLQETGWSPMQLKAQLSGLRETPGKLSAQNKLRVMNWLEEHHFKNPSREERVLLREVTGWSAKQLNGFLRYARKRKGATT